MRPHRRFQGVVIYQGGERTDLRHQNLHCIFTYLDCYFHGFLALLKVSARPCSQRWACLELRRQMPAHRTKLRICAHLLKFPSWREFVASYAKRAQVGSSSAHLKSRRAKFDPTRLWAKYTRFFPLCHITWMRQAARIERPRRKMCLNRYLLWIHAAYIGIKLTYSDM